MRRAMACAASSSARTGGHDAVSSRVGLAAAGALSPAVGPARFVSGCSFIAHRV
jgi:hypothetical protein